MPKTFENRTDELIKIAYEEAATLCSIYKIHEDINNGIDPGSQLTDDEKSYVQKFVRTFIAAQLMKKAGFDER